MTAPGRAAAPEEGAVGGLLGGSTGHKDSRWGRRVPASGPVANLLARLEKVRRNGTDWTARCPAHDDSSPSLSVSEGGDGRALVHCFAGCSVGDITAALGLTVVDLFVDPPQRDGAHATAGGVRRLVATYDYRDETGALLFQVVRFAPKSFRQRRPDTNGGWTWNLNGVRRIPYRLLGPDNTSIKTYTVPGVGGVQTLDSDTVVPIGGRFAVKFTGTVVDSFGDFAGMTGTVEGSGSFVVDETGFLSGSFQVAGDVCF